MPTTRLHRPAAQCPRALVQPPGMDRPATRPRFAPAWRRGRGSCRDPRHTAAPPGRPPDRAGTPARAAAAVSTACCRSLAEEYRELDGDLVRQCLGKPPRYRFVLQIGGEILRVKEVVAIDRLGDAAGQLRAPRVLRDQAPVGVADRADAGRQAVRLDCKK